MAGASPPPLDQESPIFSRFFRILLGLYLGLSASAAAFEYEGMILDRVVTVSNVNVPPSRIRAALSLREGEPLSAAKLRADFRSVWNLGLFRDVRFELVQVSEDRAQLVVTVDERYRVRAIRFTGIVKFSEQTLLDELPMKVEDYYSPGLLNRAVNAVRDKYRGAGFLMTRVKTELKTSDARKEVEVTFEVAEGSEMLVGRITFRGNSNLSADALKKELELKEDRWYREGKYDDLILEEDKRKLLYAYKKAGFVNARILDTRVTTRWRSPAKKDVREVSIEYLLDEGSKFLFGEVTMRGMRLFPEAELKKKLRRKVGEVFNQEVHDRDLQTLGLLYQERGYIFARITPVESIDERTKKLSYVFDIYEGEKAHVERIFIQGNDKTTNFVILRELEIQEGEVFNALKVRRSFERIMNLQFFKNVVPDYRPGSAEGLMNLIFTVEEQRTGIISAGVGIGTASGLSLNAEVRENNFRGLGQTLGFKLEFGQLRKIAQLNFTEPWILPRGPQISLGASLSASLTVQGYQVPASNVTVDSAGNKSYAANDTGVLLWTNTLGEPMSNYSPDLTLNTSLAGQLPYTAGILNASIYASTRFAYWFVFGWQNSLEFKRNFFDTLWPADKSIPSQKELSRQPAVRHQYSMYPNLLEDEPWKTTYTMTFTLARDTRDNNLNPSRGTYTKASLDLVFLNNNLTRWNLQWSAYKRFLKYFVFAWQSDLWTLGGPVGGSFSAELAQYYTFTREEVRGWEYGEIANFRMGLSQSPVYSNREFTANGFYNYGLAKVRHGLEIRFPIAEQTLWGLFFIDAGNLNSQMFGVGTNVNQWSFAVPNLAGGLKDASGKYLATPLDAFFGEYMFDLGVGLRLQLPAFPIRLYLSWKYSWDPLAHVFVSRNPKTYLFGDTVSQKMAEALRTFGDTSGAKTYENKYLESDGKTPKGLPFPEPTVVLNIFGYF